MENRQRKTWLSVKSIPDIVATWDQCTMYSDLTRDLHADLNPEEDITSMNYLEHVPQ